MTVPRRRDASIGGVEDVERGTGAHFGVYAHAHYEGRECLVPEYSLESVILLLSHKKKVASRVTSNSANVQASSILGVRHMSRCVLLSHTTYPRMGTNR